MTIVLVPAEALWLRLYAQTGGFGMVRNFDMMFWAMRVIVVEGRYAGKCRRARPAFPINPFRRAKRAGMAIHA
jgi:hypothetical protein